QHPQIFIGRSRVKPWEEINREIDELGQLADAFDVAALVAKIKEVVPEYEQHAPAYRDPSPCPLPAPVPAPAKPELVPPRHAPPSAGEGAGGTGAPPSPSPSPRRGEGYRNRRPAEDLSPGLDL